MASAAMANRKVLLGRVAQNQRRLGFAEKRQPHPPARPFGAHLRSGRSLHRVCDCKLTTTQLLPPSSRPALFRALGNSLRRHCFHRSNLGLPMFCKEIVERLGEQILNRGVAVSSEDTQLPLHCRRKIARDVALPFSAWPEVRTLGQGR
jgi:hypothetical protein